MTTAGGSRGAHRRPDPMAVAPTEPALRVLLAGSRRLDGDALRAFLAGLGIDLRSVDAGDARRAVASWRPDLVLVDLRASAAAARLGARIAREVRGVRVAGLLGSVEPALVREARRAGLRSFVTTQVAPVEFARVLRTLVEGRVVLVDGARDGDGEPAAASGGTDDAPAPEELTTREREVLELLVEGARNEEIARRLGISLSTVRSHVHSLLTKLHARSRLEAAARAVRRGLVRVRPYGPGTEGEGGAAADRDVPRGADLAAGSEGDGWPGVAVGGRARHLA
jgi:DNA-binding NarL/FixJ family response regulator